MATLHAGEGTLASLMARADAALYEAKASGRGRLTAATSPRPIYGLHPGLLAEGKITLAASRLPQPEGAEVEVTAHGPAMERVLDALAEEQIEAQRARHAAAHGEKGITHG